jgi:hypothetical protein
MRVLRIHAAAAEEAVEAAAWYENERPGLGVDFERAIDAALDLLEQDIVPLTSAPGAAGARGVKRLLLRRFPNAVVVRERGTEIFVIAFAHQARRPGYWRGRLRA